MGADMDEALGLLAHLYSTSPTLGPDVNWRNEFTWVKGESTVSFAYIIKDVACTSTPDVQTAARRINDQVLKAVCPSETVTRDPVGPPSLSKATSYAAARPSRLEKDRIIAERGLLAGIAASAAVANDGHEDDDLARDAYGGRERPRAQDVAIVTMVGQTAVKAYSEYSDYRELAQLTLQSMSEYATRWGHPLFYLHSHLMQQEKHAYWAKIDLMEHYLRMGYEYVLYTDIDVIFLQMDTPLATFIVPGKDIISVDECSQQRNTTNPLIRSGFMILRNSPATLNFLRAWKSSYPFYKDIENPEQSALEFLAVLPAYAPLFHLHSWRSFHTYDTCDGYHSAFSLHFPGRHKVSRVGRALTWFDLHRPGVGLLPHKNGPQSLATLFGGLASTQQLAAAITKAPLDLSTPDVKLYDSATRRVQQCLNATRGAAGKLGEDHVGVALYDEVYHRRVLEYDIAGYLFNIPTVIYFTVPDADNLPESVANNIRVWREMNPGFAVVVYGDLQIEALVSQYLDMDMTTWQSLLPVQKSDIWRYLVVFLFGGWYMDSDVECVRPIAEWGHLPSDTLVVGVEAENVREGSRSSPTTPMPWGGRRVILAQYCFGAAARHPAVGAVLRSILAQPDRLLETRKRTTTPEQRLARILSTTGPWAWTDAVGEYMCYADSYPRDSKDPLSALPNLAAGGHVANTAVFGIAGFGAGQDHSSSPSPLDPTAPINSLHRFGGSVAFHGQRWTTISAAANEERASSKKEEPVSRMTVATKEETKSPKVVVRKKVKPVSRQGKHLSSFHTPATNKEHEKDEPSAQKKKLMIIGWHDELVPPLDGAAKSFVRLGYEVATIGTLNTPRTLASFYDAISDADVILWWNWRQPSTDDILALRKELPDQLWVVYNWDDPHTFFVDGPEVMVDRASAWDLVFTSGEATIPLYLARGVKEAHFLPPPVDLDIFYPSPAASSTAGGDQERSDNERCDVNFALTNLYHQYDSSPAATVNRTALILALANEATKEGFNFHLYGPETINIAPRHYRGAIPYHEQRRLFASCRITINTHVNNGFGGRYANERDVLVPACGGLLLVDAKTPSVLENGKDCVMMESTEADKVAQQVTRILRNYAAYHPIRANGPQTAIKEFASYAFATTIHTRLIKYTQ